jgi:hypothetical protein
VGARGASVEAGTVILNAQTATIENGFVYLPQEAPWLAEYVHEITTFLNAKYDDQADSTSQALAWINNQPTRPAALEAVRRELARTLRGNGAHLKSSLREWIRPRRKSRNGKKNFKSLRRALESALSRSSRAAAINAAK